MSHTQWLPHHHHHHHPRARLTPHCWDWAWLEPSPECPLQTGRRTLSAGPLPGSAGRHAVLGVLVLWHGVDLGLHVAAPGAEGPGGQARNHGTCGWSKPTPTVKLWRWAMGGGGRAPNSAGHPPQCCCQSPSRPFGVTGSRSATHHR